MNVNIQWDLLRRGFLEQGITLMEQSFNETPTPSTLVTLGLGYLWIEKYEAASKHFQDWIDKYGVTMDAYFALIGAAQWCLDNYVSASESWKSGLRAQYIDMAGGIESPLLLWVASVLKSNDKLRKEAVKILGDKVRSPKVKHWPGPLAQFVLCQIDEESLNDRSAGPMNRNTPPRTKWQIAFYRHVLARERGSLSSYDFQEALERLVDTSLPEWSNEEDFLQLVRNPEFYIARHEALKSEKMREGARHP
jgi:hypothetical protein